jgi:ABC-2 type transport system ATP-binding protein
MEDVQKMLLENGWSKEIINRIFEKRHGKGKEGISTGGSILVIDSVAKSYGRNSVLDDISISIKPGEIFGIIGLSGSGKTTLLNSMVGFVEPDEGSIIIKSPEDQKSYLLSKHTEIAKKFFGFAAQNPSFYDKLTVEENMDHFSSLYSIPRKIRRERCDALIKLVGLEKSRKVLAHNLSGGMKKRLDIACSLVHNPKVLILDEPTADLDPVSRDYVWELIKQINSHGTTVILASHFVNELEHLCTRFAILHGKRISGVGTPDQLRESYSKNYEIILETKSGKYSKIISGLKSKKSLEMHKINEKNRMLTMFTPKPEQALYHIAKMIESLDEKIIDIKLNRPTMRELFESLVTK